MGMGESREERGQGSGLLGEGLAGRKCLALHWCDGMLLPLHPGLDSEATVLMHSPHICSLCTLHFAHCCHFVSLMMIRRVGDETARERERESEMERTFHKGTHMYTHVHFSTLVYDVLVCNM